MYTGHIAQCKLHCKNCTTTVAHICSINKMGRLHRMLILKACPYQQILSSKGTETTNGTASQHHPYQQICWSTRWVNRPDCSFWPPFDISCHPETTKWVARPICFISCFTRNTERAWLIMSITLDANIARPYRDGWISWLEMLVVIDEISEKLLQGYTRGWLQIIVNKVWSKMKVI